MSDAQHESNGPSHAPGAGGSRPRAAYALVGRGLEIAFLLAALSLLVFYGQLSHLRQQQVREITRVFLGIMLEALPFMLLGSIVGGLIEVFVSAERVSALVSRGRRRSVLLAAAMGLIFPVCECAIVPVVRRLVRKGAPLSAAVAYLLAGPIVNPIVAASTFVAYAGEWHMPVMRLSMGYVIAVVVGLVVGKVFEGRRAVVGDVHAPAHHDHDHEHEHDGACCGAHGQVAPGLGMRLLAAMRHAAADFVDVGRFLVIGAFVAGVLRTVVDQQQIMAYGERGMTSTLAMMGLAFVLNLCSEADAFIAASFRGVVGFTGQLAFLVLGPMLDMKLVMMYLGLFRKRTIVALVVLIAVAVFLSVSLYGAILEAAELWALYTRSSYGS